VVVASRTFEVTVYRAVWFGLGDSCRTIYDSDVFGAGALVELPFLDSDPRRDVALCARFRALKEMLGERVNDHRLHVVTARVRLRKWVAEARQTERTVRYGTGHEPDTESCLTDRTNQDC
jgi:hypothetical protein